MSKYQSTIDALRQLKEVLLAGWCKDAYALDGNGKVVDPGDMNARAWSLHGGLYKLPLETKQRLDTMLVLDDTCHALYGCSARMYNDLPTTDKAQALMLVSDAAVVLEHA